MSFHHRIKAFEQNWNMYDYPAEFRPIQCDLPTLEVRVSEILNRSRRPSIAFFALNSAKFIAKVKQWSRASFILCVRARETIADAYGRMDPCK